jgi:hypothetical protein
MTVRDHATPFERQLDRALGRAPLGPPPDLADRVLRGAGREARPRRARRGIALLAAAALVVGAAAAFAPVREALGQQARQMMALYGPAVAPRGVASATSNGTTLTVVSAYDDGDWVILGVHAVNGGAVFLSAYSLVDANGQPLGQPGSSGPQGSGDYVIAARRPAGSAAAGTELTLHVTRLWWFNQAPEQVIRGDWVLQFRVPPARSARTLAPPAPGRVGGVAVTFESVRVTSGYIDVGLQAGGATRNIADLDVRLLDPHGRTATILAGYGMPAASGGKGGPTVYYTTPDGQRIADPDAATSASEDRTWARAGAGTYRLVITSRTDPQVRIEREIAVRA